MDPERHQLLGQGGPSLLSCFDQADILVTDVSSVLSDYLSTGRPYAVCNTSGLTAEEFAVTTPSVGAGLVLAARKASRTSLVSPGASSRTRYVEARSKLREHLLGPAEPAAQTRFQAAVDSLISVPAVV